MSCLTPMCQVTLNVKEQFVKLVNVFCGLLYKKDKSYFSVRLQIDETQVWKPWCGDSGLLRCCFFFLPSRLDATDDSSTSEMDPAETLVSSTRTSLCLWQKLSRHLWPEATRNGFVISYRFFHWDSQNVPPPPMETVFFKSIEIIHAVLVIVTWYSWRICRLV